MSYPTLFALIGLIGAGIFSYGATQADISTLKRDMSNNSAQISTLSNKVDALVQVIYSNERDRRSFERSRGK